LIGLIAGGANPQPVVASPYEDQLVQRALDQKLHEKRAWHLFLHYKPDLMGGVTSEADGKAFFASPEGKTNPRSEMIATIQSFFSRPEDLPAKTEHPQCSFSARYKWLRQQLDFDPLQLPEQPCMRLENWMQQLSPEKITLIFASYFMNNPASMFGHTFLRIDSQRKGPGKKLLSYGVNYAANPDTTNAVLYALKGLVGLFPGTFSVFPFYVKVQEYSNWESRDLWEYELSFTPDQIDTLMRHLWELGGTYFDYYYFDENCSYHILSLLEIANPDLHLTDDFFYSVIPADTLKALAQNKDIIKKVSYRPAILSQMRHKTEQMTSEEKSLLSELVERPETLKSESFQSQTVPKKALVMDAYLDYLQYKAMQQEEENPDKPFRIPHSVLLTRAKLKHQRKDTKPTEFSSRPDATHGSDRLHMGTGVFDNQFFVEMGYFPTLHDLIAKDTGYNKDSQILFFDLNVRYYAELQKYRVDRFKLIDIISLTPYDPIFAKPSWRLNLGVDTLRDRDCDFCNSFKGGGGIGYSYKPSFHSPFLIYSLLDAEAEASGHLENNFRVGAGVVAGTLVDISPDWRIHFSGEYKRFPLGADSEYWKASALTRFSLSQNLDVRLEYNRIKDKDEAIFSLNVFF